MRIFWIRRWLACPRRTFRIGQRIYRPVYRLGSVLIATRERNQW